MFYSLPESDNAPTGVLALASHKVKIGAVKWNHWLERPWLISFGTLGLALLPVFLAFTHFRTAAERSNNELFTTATRLVNESLRLATVRHLSFLTQYRGQLSAALDPADSGIIETLCQRDRQNRLPHWRTVAYVEDASDSLLVRWDDDPSTLSAAREGDDLRSESRLQNAIQLSRQRPYQHFGAAWDKSHITVVGAVMDPRRTRVRGFLIGWLNLDGLCRDPQLPLVSEAALSLTPVSEGTIPPEGSELLSIEEAGAVWRVAVSRGPRFSAVFGQPMPWLVLAGGSSCAILLAALAWFAARSRGEGLRAAELRAALDAEREVSKMRSHFVSSVSHEFRTPLSVILSSADLLESYSEQLTPERRQEAFAQIQDSTEHMTQMLEEVLLLGGIESKSAQVNFLPVNVVELCADIVREVTTATGNTHCIETNLSPDLGSPLLDAKLIRTILGNLLSNAIKYSMPSVPVRLVISRNRDTISFTVQDSGIGIPPGDLLRVGEPFHRGGNVGSKAGTGLGLAIVKRCAELHRGTFRIESEEGRGTTASVSLPCSTVHTVAAL